MKAKSDRASNSLQPLKTAVLFLVFNRPDTTKQVFETIRMAKPPRLYVAADGPRPDKPGEIEKVEQTREVATRVDWDCELKTLFRDNNLGCRYAVSSGIDWFFKNEEQGIILEDDCVPGQSFFKFCEELLEKYRTDKRVWHISGYKHKGVGADKFSYNFSFYTSIWGWATWRRAWEHYDVNMANYRSIRNELMDYNLFTSKKEIKHRITILDRVSSNEIDTWDYQWNFCVRINSGLSIRPSVNLVENIGLYNNPTHPAGNNMKKQSTRREMKFPLLHPDFVMPNLRLDRQFFNTHVDRPILEKVTEKLKACFKTRKISP